MFTVGSISENRKQTIFYIRPYGQTTTQHKTSQYFSLLNQSDVYLLKVDRLPTLNLSRFVRIMVFVDSMIETPRSNDITTD